MLDQLTDHGIPTSVLFRALDQHRMPCSITDGEQFEDGVPGIDDLDEDAAYDEMRQHEVDDLNHALEDIAGGLSKEPWS